MSRSTAHRPLRRRVTVAAAVAAVAALGLGCQSNVGSAAYVGNHRITAADLSDAVDEGLANPQIRKAVDDRLGGDVAAYRRVVLDTQVQHLLVTQAADRLHVAVREGDVADQLAALIGQAGGASSARDLFARNGLTEQAGEQVVRDEVLLAEIGFANGAPRLSEDQLRAAYQSNLDQYTTMTLGVIQTPDAATATSVRDQLERDPQSFATLAQKYAGGQTTSQPQQISAANTNPALVSKLNPVQPGHAIVFSQADPTGGPGLFAVIQLVRRDVVPFETARAQLRTNSLSAAEQAAQPYLAKLAKQIGVRINPRYGQWDYTQNQVADLPDPLLKLHTASPANPANPANPPNSTGSTGTPPSK